MAVTYEKNTKIFKLDTKHTTYLIGLSPEGYVGHIYYGERLRCPAGNSLLRMEEEPMTPSVNKREKSAFLDKFPMEYPSGGIGDYRESCLNVRDSYGCLGSELRYESHRIYEGKEPLSGLPSSFAASGTVHTLVIRCVDEVLKLVAELSWSVFEEEDVITRSVRITNGGEKPCELEKVYSACLDMDNEDFEMLSLCGSWARERHIQQGPLRYGKQMVSSLKGSSSHQEHPFMALVTPGTTQRQGKVYAMNFVYSGNFIAQAERSQFDTVRMVMGIHPENFGWHLEPGASFTTPEVVMTYSGRGLGAMTRSYHDFYRKHLIRSPYRNQKRPILINNWEATYFNFNTEKLVAIARQAKECGIEMLVMDDGWFGRRNLDDSSLGDWIVNEDKLPGGLARLVEQVNALGMKFGIWFEPECISPDSDLYRAHPDWAIQIPGREGTLSRSQYVLDFSRPEIVDYIYESVARVLRSANIEYVKWDMNRQLSDLGSASLPPERMKELFHRNVLGVYAIQERLVTEFPELLLENCSGGGARFDPGMLYYSPQIWCSDDTDAIERLQIQEGTALIYPLSTMGAHVSDCPNHAVGRTTPFETRGHVALAGTFGYELDITRISKSDRSQIPAQVALYHKYNDLIREGDYYRIESWRENGRLDCWEVAAKDQSEALVTYVQVLAQTKRQSRKVYLEGLQEDGIYELEGSGKRYTGEELMKVGFLVPDLHGDFLSRLYHFVRTA